MERGSFSSQEKGWKSWALAQLPNFMTAVPSGGRVIVQSMENTVSEFVLRSKLSLQAVES